MASISKLYLSLLIISCVKLKEVSHHCAVVLMRARLMTAVEPLFGTAVAQLLERDLCEGQHGVNIAVPGHIQQLP